MEYARLIIAIGAALWSMGIWWAGIWYGRRWERDLYEDLEEGVRE